MNQRMKAMMEAQKKAAEEQNRLRAQQMQMTLKQLKTSRKMVERTIDRIKADRDVVEQLELAKEENALRKKAIRAKLAEIDAIVEGEMLKLEMIDLNMENVKRQMEAPASAGNTVS